MLLSDPPKTAPHLFEAGGEIYPDVERFAIGAVNLGYDTNTAEWMKNAGEEAGYEHVGTQIWDAGGAAEAVRTYIANVD